MSESENDEDFVPDAKAEKEYESEMARQKIESTNEKEGFGMTEEESKGWFQSFFQVMVKIRISGILLDTGKNFMFYANISAYTKTHALECFYTPYSSMLKF